ncbi:MAG: ABC transporter permease [Erysipelotrichaceae bacterium]|nr:ABC transporter permease [Erysipelotrichaceae bacterium]
MRSKIFSFNWNYGKQNLKTNIGIYFVIFLILPLILIPTLLNHSSNVRYLTLEDLSLLPGLFVYIIPILLVFVLYGFLFSRKQVDFICSFPLSRKEIFWTNYWIGLGILIASLLVSALVILLVVWLQPNQYIAGIVLFRFVIFYSISAFLTFSIATFAISCTGNRLTALLLAITIMFLPSMIRFYEGTSTYTYFQNSGFIQERNQEVVYLRNRSQQVNFYYPTSLNALAPQNELQISQLVLTTIEAVVYTGCAYLVFKRRKMEVAQSTFIKQKTHDIVRTLFIFLPLFLVIGSFGSIYLQVIFIIIFFVLFYLYDLMTRRTTHSFNRSILLYLMTVVLVVVVQLGRNMLEDFCYHPLTRKDIKSITVELPSFIRCTDQDFENVITIDQKEFIDAFFDPRYFQVETQAETYQEENSISIRLNTRWNSYEYKISNINSKGLDEFIINYLANEPMLEQQWKQAPFMYEDLYAMNFSGMELDETQFDYLLQQIKQEPWNKENLYHHYKNISSYCLNGNGQQHGICNMDLHDRVYFSAYQKGLKHRYYLDINTNETLRLYLWNQLNQDQFNHLKQFSSYENVISGYIQIYDDKETEYYIGKDSSYEQLSHKIFNWLQQYEYQPLTTFEHQQLIRIELSMQDTNISYRDIKLLLPMDEEIKQMIQDEVIRHVYD